MSPSKRIALVALALVALGGAFAAGRLTASSAPRAGGRERPSTGLEALERENVRLHAEVEALRARESPRLEGTRARVEPERPVAAGASDAVPEGVRSETAETGVAWARFEQVLGEHLSLLLALKDREGEELTPEEQRRVFAVMAELMRVSAEARALSAHPFFDERVLPGLVRTVFGAGLDLSGSDRETLARATREILARQVAGFDPANALPLERYHRRRAIESAVAQALADVVPADRRDRLEDMRDLQGELFGGTRRVVTLGLGDPPEPARVARAVVEAWAETYALTPAQQADAEGAASALVRTAEDLLAHHGVGAGEGWEPGDEPALAEAFLRAQMDAEATFLSRLPVGQRERANAAMPTILWFDRTDGSSTHVTAGPGF